MMYKGEKKVICKMKLVKCEMDKGKAKQRRIETYKTGVYPTVHIVHSNWINDYDGDIYNICM